MFLFKYAALEQQALGVRKNLETRVSELEEKLAQQDASGETEAEVRRPSSAHMVQTESSSGGLPAM